MLSQVVKEVTVTSFTYYLRRFFCDFSGSTSANVNFRSIGSTLSSKIRTVSPIEN